MPRVTLIVEVDKPDQCEAAIDWMRRWWPQLRFVSENSGCGCCVDIWDVQGPQEALDDLPPEVAAAGSEWMDSADQVKLPDRNLRAAFAEFPGTL